MVRLKSRYMLFEVLYTDEYNPSGNELEHTAKFHIPSDAALDARKLAKLFRQSVELNFGDFGMGAVASTLSVKYFSSTTSTGIVRIARQHLRLLWAALTYICQIDGRAASIRVVHVSGTIRLCQKAAIKRNQQFVDDFSEDET